MKKIILFVISMVAITLCCGCQAAQKQISDKEINRLIQGRQQIRHVTEIDCLRFDTNNNISLNGYYYYPVIDEKYDEWSEWTDYVKSIYAEEAAKMVLSNDKIIEIDGKTYTNDGSKGDDLSDEYTYEIVSQTDDTATIILKNTDVFTSETIEREIVFENTPNGWRIKNY